MAASWMIRHRSLRSGRTKSKITFEDEFKLDPSCKPIENAWRLLTQLCTQNISTSRRFSLLNAFVVLSGTKAGYCAIQSIFSIEDLLTCLRISLVHECTQIRAAALRAFRRIMKTKETVQIFNEMQLPHLICRCIDIVLKNEMERIQAFQLIRRLLILSPEGFSPILARAMVALGMGGSEQGERLLRACLAILCEIGILNPDLLINCGGVGVILHNILECHSPRIAESLVGVLLHLLENPKSRAHSEVRLEMLAAPYCDFQYRLGILDKSKDARDIRITCSRLALLSVLRSWAGTLQFCNPDKPSGLSSIVSVLYLNQLEVRKAVLDLLYELVGLPQPAWTDEYSVAIATLDPTDFQDQWRLNEGFVAAECRSILPTLVSTVPSPAEMHLALLLYCLLESGVLPALIEVVVASDTFLSVRATILLGKLLNMIHILLPPDIYNASPALPSLIAHASSNKPQALAAIAVLENINTIMECRPASASLFLDQILLSGSLVKTQSGQNDNNTSTSGASDISHFEISSISQDKTLKLPKKSKVLHFFTSLREAEDLIRDSNVLIDKDGASWNWDIVRAVLKSTPSSVADESYLRFFRRLVQYFSPSCNRFSHQDLAHGRHSLHCVHAGSELVDWLIRAANPDYLRLLYDLFGDISSHVTAISKSKSAHECLFSPQHMLATLCQMYFLYIGRLCKYERGLDLLQQTDIFPQFIKIVETTNHICYVKLIVSGLDYTLDALPRKILANALNSPIVKSRLYATQFLLVLLRTKAIDFVEWGFPLLVKQIEDKELCVSQVALEILTEACNEQVYLNKLISLWPPLLTLGDPGRLLRTRLFSIPAALQRLREQEEATAEIDHWANYYNKRYVLIVESETHCCLTQNNRNADVTYSQRVNSARNSNTLVLPTLPPHLYGQLVQSESGLVHLSERGMIPQMIQYVLRGECGTEDEILTLKAHIWAIGHVASHVRGLKYLFSCCDSIIANIITLAKSCYVYSVRATAFFVLGLIGSTFAGANLLQSLGWLCVRHNRNEIWPIVFVENRGESYRSPNPSRPLSRTSPYNESKMSTRKSPNPNNNGHLPYRTTCDCDKNDTAHGLDVSHDSPASHSSKRNTFPTDTLDIDTSILDSSSDKNSRLYNTRMRTSTLSEYSAVDALEKSFYSDCNIDDYGSVTDNSNRSDLNSSLKNRLQSNISKGSNILQQSSICDENLVEDANNCCKMNNSSCYMGICLPVSIREMFSYEDSYTKTSPIYKTNSIEKKKCSQWTSDDINDMAYDISNSESQVFIHELNNCLLCCRSRNSKSKSMTLDKIPDESESENSPSEYNNSANLTCLILKHIQRTSNPVWYKQSKQSLLELKQSHPLAFQDICLYSEMCNSMSRSTYRLNARRFLQELFLDLNFDKFYNECDHIVRNLPSLEFMLRDSLSVVDVPTPLDDVPSTSNTNYQHKKLFRENIITTKAEVNLPGKSSVTNFQKEDFEQDCATVSTSSKSEETQQLTRTKLLNLSCTKNKFPITNRIASQAADHKTIFPISSNFKTNSSIN